MPIARKTIPASSRSKVTKILQCNLKDAIAKDDYSSFGNVSASLEALGVHIEKLRFDVQGLQKPIAFPMFAALEGAYACFESAIGSDNLAKSYAFSASNIGTPFFDSVLDAINVLEIQSGFKKKKGKSSAVMHRLLKTIFVAIREDSEDASWNTLLPQIKQHVPKAFLDALTADSWYKDQIAASALAAYLDNLPTPANPVTPHASPKKKK